MKITRILSVLVVAASIGNQNMYAAAGSVVRSDIQGRDVISSALKMILAQAIQQDRGANEDSFAYNSARVWTLSIKQAGLEHIVNEYADKDDDIREHKQVYLDTGNAGSGLEHIWLGHQNDFRKLANVNSENELQNFIHRLMSIGQYSAYSYRKIPDKKGGGFQVIYEVDGGVYLSVIIARNGYIVTATIANDATKKRLYNGPNFKYDFNG